MLDQCLTQSKYLSISKKIKIKVSEKLLGGTLVLEIVAQDTQNLKPEMVYSRRDDGCIVTVFFLLSIIAPKIRQGEFFMHKEMVCDFVLSAFTSELRDNGHRLLNFLILFLLLCSEPF